MCHTCCQWRKAGMTNLHDGTGSRGEMLYNRNHFDSEVQIVATKFQEITRHLTCVLQNSSKTMLFGWPEVRTTKRTVFRSTKGTVLRRIYGCADNKECRIPWARQIFRGAKSEKRKVRVASTLLHFHYMRCNTSQTDPSHSTLNCRQKFYCLEGQPCHSLQNWQHCYEGIHSNNHNTH